MTIRPRMKTGLRAATLACGLLAMALAGCTQIDCPLNNSVYATYQLAGDVEQLTDVLSVYSRRMDGTDTLLLNQSEQTTRFYLPLSYGKEEDELIFYLLSSENEETFDTLRIRKTNESHFESVDCGPAFFHTIQNIQSTRHAIDSVVIANSRVDYDSSRTTFKVYFKPGY